MSNEIYVEGELLDCDACGGSCCKDFSLAVSPMTIEFEAKAFEVTGRQFYSGLDMVKLRDNLIFLRTNFIGKEIRGVKVREFKPEYSKQPHMWRYKCKLHDSITGRCTDYENRFPFCKSFDKGQKSCRMYFANVCKVLDKPKSTHL